MKTLATLFYSFFVLLSLPALAEKVGFKQSVNPFTAKVGQEFRIEDLRTLLSGLGSGNLSWTIGQDAPSWVVLDSANHKLTGTPVASSVGTSSFRIIVTDKTTLGEQSAIGQMQITVIAPPIWTTPNIDLGIQNEDLPMPPFDLKRHVENPAGGTLSFSATGLPAWMSLSSEGIITGTPKRENVGDYSGIVFTATGPGGSSTATGFGKVLKTVKPPKWVSNPIQLPDAFEHSSYSQALKPFVLDFENSSFTFEKVSGAAWASVNAQGLLFGTPSPAHLGLNSVTVTFRTTIDGTEYTGSTVFQINVLNVNEAPYWVSNPLPLPAATTKQLYTQDLSGSAKDPDAGDKLSFRLVSGPSWASVTPGGTISGTPDKSHVGINRFEVEAKDLGGLTAITVVEINVIKANEPPTWLAKPTILPNAKEDAAYSIDLHSYVQDPDGDPLTFTSLLLPSWLTLSANGVLTGTPKAKEIGLNKLQIKVADNISGSDVTDLIIEVEHVNHAPEWLLNPIKVTVKEDQKVSFTVKGYAKDIDANDTLSFQLINGPSWAQFSADGTFTGVPVRENVGENTFTIRVSDNAALFADAKLIVIVEQVNKKPFWTANPIVLPNGPEKVFYSQSLLPFAKDPDNDVLVFTKISGSDWINISADGVLSGTPLRKHVGPNTAIVRIMDPSNELAETTVQITIDKVNQPPRWRQDPILMSDATEDKSYSFDLTTYAIDDDNDPLTYRLVSGPAWMQVSPAGIVSGVPRRADVGPFAAVFEVADPSQATAQTNGKASVIKVNKPPQISNELPTFIVKERSTFKVSMTQYVTDPDNDATFNFTFPNSPDWIAFFKNGEVVIKPLFKHIGDHSFPFSVDDGELSTQGALKIRVIRDPRPPIWLEDPMRYEAKTNQLFSESVALKARDLDNLPLTFSKKSGKDWLQVTAGGSLSGTPKEADLGENTFRLSACNDLLCAEADVIITVKPGTQIDSIAIDKPVPGAPAENLWVIDTTNQCAPLTQSLKKHIGVYFDALKAAEIHHSGIYLSSNAYKWDGRPVFQQNLNPLLLWNDSLIASDFTKRMDLAARGDEEDASKCGNNCYNSPIWSMYRFYQRLPSLPDIYHKGYFNPGVPMSAMVVSPQRDHFKYFSQKKPEAGWVAQNYAEKFIELHDDEMKPFRISVIAPDCLTTVAEETLAAPENAYRVLSSKTSGDYYKAPDCNVNVKPFLEDFAKKVIQKAYIHAKSRIKLSKVPMDVSTLKVFVSGLELPGNTGSADDKWKYDAQTNEVILYWYLIDQGQLKPGDEIRIEYRVS